MLAALGSGSLTALAGCPGDGDSDAGGEDGGRTEGEDGGRTEDDDRTPTTDNPPAAIGPSQIFTGEDRVFVVNGYSTSRDWPGLLQRKLDRYFDGDSPIRVVNTWESRSPIDDWINTNTDERTALWEENLAPALDRDVPVVALAQQSLQGVYGDYSVGIRGSDDDERIQQGADAIETYARLLLEDGADHAVVATHIYKTGMEPEVGNERLALDALLSRDPEGISRGPDVWTPTRDHHPEAFAEDGVHPNTIGAEIMAHYWFERLFELDGREVPPWSREEMGTALEGETDDAVDGEYYVAPDGSDDNAGSEAAPLGTLREGLSRAGPGDTIHLAPGEYREEVRTVRDGEPDAPITITGPQDAVLRAPPGAYTCLAIIHNHVHVRGITIVGLIEPDRKYETRDAYSTQCVGISSVNREDVDYVRGVVLEPSRMGHSGGPIVQTQRIRDSTIGNFEVIGPAGMNFDRRVDDHEIGHVREIVYIGSPEVDRGESYYGYDTLDRSRNVRIHHIDNSAGYRHNELVDVKLGSSEITVEYCTDRNAGHNTEGGVDAAIDLKGNDCTVRWNDIGDCPLPLSFGAWAPSDDIDGADWSRNNAVYGNHIHGFAAGPFRLRNRLDQNIGPASFEAQRVLCGNRIERGDPPVDPWVGEPNGYDGTAVSHRGKDEVAVDVGAGPNGRALDPAAIVVDRGATVTWEWTGDGDHYVIRQGRVEDDPETVPDPISAPYSMSKTFDEVGLYRYACYEHHEEGMRGAVIVTDDEDRYAFAREDCGADTPDGDGVGHMGGQQ